MFKILGLFPGEDSGKVMIWNMAPVLREEDEKNENIPKMLCQMDNHLGNQSLYIWLVNECICSLGHFFPLIKLKGYLWSLKIAPHCVYMEFSLIN